MDFLFNGSMLLVDLEKRSCEEQPLPRDLISTCLGGARANLALLQEFPQTDLVLGSGPLTGLPVPGACMAVATWKKENGVTHTPLHLYMGVELKLSGFDFVLVSGASPEPLYLWLHDGIADLEPAGELPPDNWEAVDALRRELGDQMVQVLVAGEGPCLGLGYWSSADRVGLGEAWRIRGLRALCARGLGIIDASDPGAFAEACSGLLREVRDSLPEDMHGLEGIIERLQGEEFGYSLPLLHRRRSCFACPYDCNIFLKTEEDPGHMEAEGEEEPGLLLTDARSLQVLEESGADLREGVRLLRRAARLGAYPAGAASIGSKASDRELLSAYPCVWEVPEGPFSPWVTPRPLYEGGDWKERQALAYTLGICPQLMLLSPVMEAETFCGLLGASMGLELEPQELLRICLEVAT